MAKEVIRVVAAVIEHGGRYLITQRNANAVLPLLWEFPGGRVEPDESETHALLREVKGRIGVEVIVGPKLGFWTSALEVKQTGLATLCLGGGNAVALSVERMS